ncbi:hypothetical protein BB560_000285 [Smittium megazygosporum]|uniref:OPT family small oligopeptide transporter n=1 Tax=Smittium megazygosporum TaxID=133381 RepID=A0A2T9ZKU8_9FUNG|nr:hypothetical protein BB560_000285 [Smittium megazygosporum]
MDQYEDFEDVESEKSFYEDDTMSYLGYDEEIEDDGTHGLVRAIVSSEDDTTLPVFTFRFWVIGTFFVILISIANTLTLISTRALNISLIVAQLFSFPMGTFMAKYIPDVNIGFGKFKFSLNPGPFNIKEHSAITIYAGLSFGISDLVVFLLQNNTYYPPPLSDVSAILLLGSSSLTGFGIQKMIGEYLVKSPDMLFPAVLVTITLLRSLHDKADTQQKSGISGIKFVLIVAFFAACYAFIPQILWKSLGYLSIFCYIFPNSRVVHQVMSGNAGLGVGSISLDWSVITGYGMAPLIMPLWSAANSFVGFVIVAWVVTPLLYYTDTLNFAYFPIFSRRLFDMYGGFYNTMNVVGPDNQLDVQKYLAYSPLKLNVSIYLAYFFSFAGIVALTVHFLLNYTKDLISYMQNVIIDSKKVVGGFGDIHNRLMRFYKPVPMWWSLILIIVCLTCALIGCETSGGDVKWYIYIFSAAVGMTLFFPIAIVYAISNLRMSTSIVLQAFVGYLCPGRPVANIASRTFGDIIVSQAIQSAENFKLGHYMKLPPRSVYLVQIIGTFGSFIISYYTVKIMKSLEPDLCKDYSPNWSCIKIKTIFSASSIWGLFGPSELFDVGREYATLWISIGVGVLAPLLTFFLSKRFPGTWVSFIHTPIIFVAASNFPPNTSSALISSFIISFIFNFYIYRYKHAWWTKYNYLLSSGIDLGTIVCLTVIGVLGPSVPQIKWFGNEALGGCSHALEPAKV